MEPPESRCARACDASLPCASLESEPLWGWTLRVHGYAPLDDAVPPRDQARARDASRARPAVPALQEEGSSAAAGDGWLREGVAAAPYWAAGRDDFSCWGGVGRACAPALETHSGGECGVYRAIVATGILPPRVERSCAGKKGGRTVHSASVSNGVGGPRRAYSASGYVSRTDNPLVRRRRRR